MNMKIVAVAVVATLAFTACGQAPDNKVKEAVTFASLEEAKQTSRENSLWNAQMYRQSNPLYKGWDIVSRGDSTQTNECPQGDGWATLEFIAPEKNVSLKVKCSTVSSATGCIEDKEFKSKPFAGDDNVCQPLNKVPYPLPKIAK